MTTPTNLTRVVDATSEGRALRATRNLNVGMFVVQRWSMSSWARGDITKGQWNEVSSHHSMQAAEAALAKLNKKLAKIGG